MHTPSGGTTRRLAFLYLTRLGRREGMSCIFSSIKAFIENSPVTKRKTGTTFHETMTYFFTHMVHYALAATKLPEGAWAACRAARGRGPPAQQACMHIVMRHRA